MLVFWSLDIQRLLHVAVRGTRPEWCRKCSHELHAQFQKTWVHFYCCVHGVDNIVGLCRITKYLNIQISGSFFSSSNIQRKKMQLPQKKKFTLNLFLFLIGVSVIIPHHPLIYICKPILLAMLFAWCRPGYVSFEPSPVASFHVLAKPDSGFNPNNGATNHCLESPY